MYTDDSLYIFNKFLSFTETRVQGGTRKRGIHGRDETPTFVPPMTLRCLLRRGTKRQEDHRLTELSLSPEAFADECFVDVNRTKRATVKYCKRPVSDARRRGRHCGMLRRYSQQPLWMTDFYGSL